MRQSEITWYVLLNCVHLAKLKYIPKSFSLYVFRWALTKKDMCMKLPGRNEVAITTLWRVCGSTLTEVLLSSSSGPSLPLCIFSATLLPNCWPSWPIAAPALPPDSEIMAFCIDFSNSRSPSSRRMCLWKPQLCLPPQWFLVRKSAPIPSCPLSDLPSQLYKVLFQQLIPILLWLCFSG